MQEPFLRDVVRLLVICRGGTRTSMHVINIFCGIVLQTVHLYKKYFNWNLYRCWKYLSSLRFCWFHSSFEGNKGVAGRLERSLNFAVLPTISHLEEVLLYRNWFLGNTRYYEEKSCRGNSIPFERHNWKFRMWYYWNWPTNKFVDQILDNVIIKGDFFSM